MASQTQIAQQVVESILAQKLRPGERLGEQELADLFGVSRTLVREALMQLQARGFVEVRTRKGWYVVEPSLDEARDAFAARRAVEGGMLRQIEGKPLQSVIRRLRQHIAEEKRAVSGTDAPTRAFLLADFHVCLADCLGHRLLCDMLRDLTARTTLVATLYQSRHDARESCADHGKIVDALEAGDRARAEVLMLDHLGSVESALGQSITDGVSAVDKLRATLRPLTPTKASPLGPAVLAQHDGLRHASLQPGT
jgi:DNA-binding GntR family transcriptional regulator